MKKLFLITSILLLGSTINCSAQNTPLAKKVNLRNNTIYAELGGNSNLGSINYERFIINKNKGKHQLGLRLGVGKVGFYSKQIAIPTSLNYLYAIYKNNFFADLGLGYTYTKAFIHGIAIVDIRGPFVQTCYHNFVPSLGLRYQTAEGVFVRGSLLVIANNVDGFPHIGLTVGKRF